MQQDAYGAYPQQDPYQQAYGGNGYGQMQNMNYPMNGGGGYPDPSMPMPMQSGYASVGMSSGYGSMGNSMKKKKSFSGPQTKEERQASLARRRSSARFQSMHSVRSSRALGDGNAQDGLARHGSVFVNKHARNTQEQVSMYGAMDDDEDEKEDLKQYYGDMATRQEDKELDGVRAIRSYRGTVEDGQDIGKPRRVTTTRSHSGKATGYGGINFKRDVAMRKGEEWGDLEIRRRNKNKSRDLPMQPQQQQQPMYQPPMMVMMDAPVVPQVYNQDDVQTYSNLSDAFAEEELAGDEDEDNEFD